MAIFQTIFVLSTRFNTCKLQLICNIYDIRQFSSVIKIIVVFKKTEEMNALDSAITNKLDHFFSGYPLRKYKRGQILIHANDQPKSIYQICSGKVRQYTITDSGDEIVLGLYRANAVFPLSLTITDVKNEYFYESSEDLSLRIAPGMALKEYLSENPDAVYGLLKNNEELKTILLKRMSYFMGGNAYTRLLNELILECQQVPKSKLNSYQLKVHEYELANQVGLSRETASRELRKLKLKGFINVGHKFITVVNFLGIKNELRKMS